MFARVVLVLAIGVGLGLGIALVAHHGHDLGLPAAFAAPQLGAPPSRVARIVSQGSVLTSDGQIWVYRPDQDRWLTVDQAFKDEGRETHIVPLPVPVGQVKDMASFGFLLTEGGEVWFYEISTDKWRKLVTPS
jgi:hypothetical protein